MLRTNPIRPSTISQIWAAVILVIALGAVAYIKLAPATPHLSIYAGNSVPQSNPQVAVSVSPYFTNSVYISNQTLRNWIDQAYDQHKILLAQKYQKILDGRYALRVRAPY